MKGRDGLKPLDEILKPDVRNGFFVRMNKATGQHRANSIEDHYADIEHHALHEQVPEDIATQYDVARNLYIYAWFEYRFFNVAEAKVLTVLELALKKRVQDRNLKAYLKQRSDDAFQATGKHIRCRPGLKTLIEYCRDRQLVKNEGFSAWRRHGAQQAHDRAIIEAIETMRDTGEDCRLIDTGKFADLPPDENYDHIQHLIDHVNKIRNIYAHGTTMLHPNVLYSFEMVSEFINQLYGSTEQERANP